LTSIFVKGQVVGERSVPLVAVVLLSEARATE
jgi:hypothetical protein